MPTIQRAGNEDGPISSQARGWYDTTKVVRFKGVRNVHILNYRGVAPSLANPGASGVQIASIVFVGLNQPLETTECGDRVQVYTSPSVFCDRYCLSPTRWRNEMDEKWDQKARDALIRMSKAFRYCRGVRVSWEELEVLNRTHIGELWSDIERDSLLPQPNPIKQEE